MLNNKKKEGSLMISDVCPEVGEKVAVKINDVIKFVEVTSTDINSSTFDGLTIRTVKPKTFFWHEIIPNEMILNSRKNC
jgi:hypothetical protein